MSMALCKVVSWDVSNHLHWFMFLHPWKDNLVISWFKNEGTLESVALVAVFIDGECYAGVGSAQLVENECCEIPSSSFSVPLEMPGAFRSYFDWLLEEKVVLLSVSICINCQVACGL